MPIPTTLEHQFSNLSTQDRPVTKDNADGRPITSSALVTPTKEDFSSSASLHDHDSVASDDSPVAISPSNNGYVGGVLQKTDHKLREERGELAPEPLLMENPHRFVIFPIQDNEVRRT